MNTKGMKFLAVLAVLAMAFAAFAVVAPAETDDATAATYNDGVITIGDQVIPYEGEVAAGNYYYFAATADVALPADTGSDAPIVVFIKNGVSVSFTTHAETTASGDVDLMVFAIESATDTTITLPTAVKSTFEAGFVAEGVLKALAFTPWSTTKLSQLDLAINAGETSKTFDLAAANGTVTLVTDADLNLDLYQSAYDLSGDWGTITNYNTNGTKLKLVNFSGTIVTSTVETKASTITFTNVTTGTVEIAKSGLMTVDVTLADLEGTENDGQISVAVGSAIQGKVKCGDNVVNVALAAGTNVVTIAPGSVVITGNVISGDGAAYDIVAAIEAVGGDVKIGALTLTEGKLTLSGDIDVIGALTVNAGSELVVASGANIDATAVGGSIALGAADDPNVAKLTVNGAVSGTINAEDATAVLTKNTGADLSGAVINENITVKDKVDPSKMEVKIVSGRDVSQYVYSANQSVHVEGNYTLMDTSDVTIKGEFIVPAGSKFVIEPGAKFTLLNEAKLIVYGQFIIEEAADDKNAVANINDGTLEVYGIMQAKGTLNVGNEATATKDGYVVIEEGATAQLASSGRLVMTTDNSKLTVKENAVFTIKGAIDTRTIFNYGQIIINTDNAAIEDSTIYMAASGAIVDVQKFIIGASGETLKITDKDMVYYVNKITDRDNPVTFMVNHDLDAASNMDADGNETLDFVTKYNEVTLSAGTVDEDYVAVITGITITENVKVTSYDTQPTTTPNGYVGVVMRSYTNTIAVEGEIAVTYSYIGTGEVSEKAYTATLAIDAEEGANILAGTSLVAGPRVTISNVANSVLKVSGNVDASFISNNAGNAAFSNAGTVTLDGNGLVLTNSPLAGTVNAAKIDVGFSPRIYNYMTVDVALDKANADSTIEQITLLGNNTLTKTNTIPEGVTVQVSAGKLTIGKTAGADVLLTVDEDADLRGSGTITVNGTLFAEDKSKVKGNTIIADVMTIELDESGRAVSNGWAKWTNIVTALNTAQAGDTIVISKDKTAGVVAITGDSEIKAGVTLEIPEDKAPLFLYNGVTLTVNGVLVSEELIYAQSMFDVNAKNAGNTAGDKSSAIKVNGTLITSQATNYNYNERAPQTGKTITTATTMSAGAPIAGAYYVVDDYNVISALEVAVAVVDEIDGNITVNGAVSATALTFTDSDNCYKLIVGNNIVDGDAIVVETILSVGTLTLDGTELAMSQREGSAYGTFNGKVVVGSSAVEIVGMTPKTGETASIADANGKLTIKGSIEILDKGDALAISAGEVYTAVGSEINSHEYADKYETMMTVQSGATLVPNGGEVDQLMVYGTLSVPNGVTFTVTTLFDEGTVIVAGATASKTSGTLNATTLYIGLRDTDVKYHTAAAAVFNGSVASDLVYVLNGSTLDEDMQTTLDNMAKSTKIYVEGMDWVDVYAPAATNIKIDHVPVESAMLIGFAAYAGGFNVVEGPDANGAYTITVGAYEALYAVIDYNIYNVYILTDNGIKSVAIDGIEMVHVGNNMFAAYDDINELSSNLGGKLAAGTHTVSYTTYNGYTGLVNLYTADNTILKDMKFVLSGVTNTDVTFQLYGTEQSITPEPEPEPAPSEWTITTILLLILVILIAVMAVIVALRLNRS